jgi:hypothetical protein
MDKILKNLILLNKIRDLSADLRQLNYKEVFIYNYNRIE